MMRGLAFALVVLVAGSAAAASVSGQYVEVRNAAMWAGPCLANSEMGLVGDKATLAWKVQRGEYEGTSLNGLAVVALVVGDRSFGMGHKVKTRTVFLVDERASEAQQAALIAMAKTLAGETIQKVIDVKRSKIEMEVAEDDSAYALVEAGTVKICTRSLHRSDNLCGTDTSRMVYPALAKITVERSAYTLENSFSLREPEIAVRHYEDHNTPSALLGSFSL